MQLYRRIKDETAGAMVENVIVLPLVFVIIIFMIVSAFLIHDRTTIEAAAKRGAIYASHCISDPNYASLVGQSGDLDFSRSPESINFASVGQNIDAYRYIVGGASVQNVVEEEVKKIVDKTRIHWIPQENIDVKCDQENKIIYQNVAVTVTATYHLPSWFRWFGLETEYKVETVARLAAVDPDEFIRNADLVVDLVTQVDTATGGHIAKALDTIGGIAAKLLDWINME